MRARRRAATPSPDQVLAGSITGILLVLLAVLVVWGPAILPALSLESTAQVLSAVLLIAVIGLLTLLVAGRGN